MFVEDIKRQMRSFAIGRRVRKKEEGFELREPQSSYKALFDTEKVEIEWKNLWLWNEKKVILECYLGPTLATLEAGRLQIRGTGEKYFCRI